MNEHSQRIASRILATGATLTEEAETLIASWGESAPRIDRLADPASNDDWNAVLVSIDTWAWEAEVNAATVFEFYTHLAEKSRVLVTDAMAAIVSRLDAGDSDGAREIAAAFEPTRLC